jgi:L-alanine-DL-glutamate epimerase-like enolase superfamily enzyme
MVIKEVELFPVRIPTIRPYTLSFGKQTAAESVVARIRTDCGLFGVGEASPSANFCEESIYTVFTVLKAHLRPAILGMDAFDIEKIHKQMDQAIKGNSFAKAAIDIALYDLVGKKLNVPVYRLLGGLCREEFALTWPLMDADLEGNVKDAQDAVQRGFRSFCIKVAKLIPQEDVARVKAIREAVGDECELWVDANQGWTPQVAIECISQMQQYNLAWVEQPVPRWDTEGLCAVKDAVGVRISADESLFSIHDAVRLLRYHAVDIFSVKVQKSEGLLRAKKIAAVAEGAGLPVFINSMVEMGISVAASLHFAASTPNIITSSAALMSTLRLKDDILRIGLEIDGPRIRVTGKPGLGIELDENKLVDYAYPLMC